MAEDAYFFDGFTTLDLTESEGSTPVPVAGIQGVTIRTLSVSVSGITFSEFPIIDGSAGEYISRDMSGTGSDIDDVSTTDNTV